jgi:hypothetical protein
MRASIFILVFVLHVAFTSFGFAQKELGSEVKIGLSYVLKYNGVAQDLELADNQKEKLTGLWVEVETKLEHAFQDYKANYSPRFSDEQQEKLKGELETQIADIRVIELERLKDALIPDQFERLEQIRFQILKRNSDGLQGLVTELSITDDQIQKIKGVQIGFKETLLELRQYAREQQLTPNEIVEDVAGLRKENEEKLFEVLTSTQRSKLERLQGELFVVQTGTPKKEDD